MTRKRKKKGIVWELLSPLAIVVLVICFATALDSLDSGRAEENARQLEESLRRGCIACYAAEGFYPPDLLYLKEHYGLQIVEEKYIVRYTALGENLMPDITVLEKKS